MGATRRARARQLWRTPSHAVVRATWAHVVMTVLTSKRVQVAHFHKESFGAVPSARQTPDGSRRSTRHVRRWSRALKPSSAAGSVASRPIPALLESFSLWHAFQLIFKRFRYLFFGVSRASIFRVPLGAPWLGRVAPLCGTPHPTFNTLPCFDRIERALVELKIEIACMHFKIGIACMHSKFATRICRAQGRKTP